MSNTNDLTFLSCDVGLEGRELRSTTPQPDTLSLELIHAVLPFDSGLAPGGEDTEYVLKQSSNISCADR